MHTKQIPMHGVHSVHSVHSVLGVHGRWHTFPLKHTLHSVLTFSAPVQTFYILLTVHHVTILAKWPPWRTILSTHLLLFLTLYMFRAHRAHHQERQIVSVQPLVAVRGRVVFRPCIRHGHRHRVRATRGCIDTICLPDDEHDVFETCRQLKTKINT